ncbi:hypothetical protein [Streptomyces sp. NBC_00280]
MLVDLASDLRTALLVGIHGSDESAWFSSCGWNAAAFADRMVPVASWS